MPDRWFLAPVLLVTIGIGAVQSGYQLRDVITRNSDESEHELSLAQNRRKLTNIDERYLGESKFVDDTIAIQHKPMDQLAVAARQLVNSEETLYNDLNNNCDSERLAQSFSPRNFCLLLSCSVILRNIITNHYWLSGDLSKCNEGILTDNELKIVDQTETPSHGYGGTVGDFTPARGFAGNDDRLYTDISTREEGTVAGLNQQSDKDGGVSGAALGETNKRGGQTARHGELAVDAGYGSRIRTGAILSKLRMAGTNAHNIFGPSGPGK